MALVQVQCLQCQRTDGMHYEKQTKGIQRYRCDNHDCQHTIFLLQYHDKGRLPDVKQ